MEKKANQVYFRRVRPETQVWWVKVLTPMVAALLVRFRTILAKWVTLKHGFMGYAC